MKTLNQAYLALLPVVLLMASCATMQPTANVRDDVYYLPSMDPTLASASPMPEEGQPSAGPVDDYYDPKTSQQLGADRSYYDMTYNDPYFYNYGRFGFNNTTGYQSSMGYQSGWNSPGWGSGMSLGIGYGMGAYSGWSNPGMNSMFGWGNGYNSWGSPYYNSWNNPYGGYGYNSPYYGSYGGGYGYGNYYGPCGSCSSCYTPVIVGGSSNVVVGHRPSMGSGGGVRTSPGSSRMTLRDPVGLSYPRSAFIQSPEPYQRANAHTTTGYDQRRGGSTQTGDPYRRATSQPNRGTSEQHRSTHSQGGSAPSRSFDGGRTSPSHSTGGGFGGSGGGGGTRSSPSHR